MIYGNLESQKILRELVEKDVSPILVVGPEGVGKFSFLKEYLDLQKIEKIAIQTEDKNFKIETARALVSLSQKKSEKRIVLIDNAHKFQIYSQNTFLKTFEETPSKTIFILVSHQENKILPTIRSRSIKVKFGLVKKEETEKFLKEKGFSQKDIDLALNFYPYQPGKALRFLNSKKFELLNKFLIKKDFNFEELKNNFTLQEFLENYLLFLRKELLEKIKERKLISQEIKKIKDCLNLYHDSDYNLNFELQLANLLLSHG
jgi:DNA polymerase III delta prime subunit